MGNFDAMIGAVTEGDCLNVMKRIPDSSIDLILCDLPYGTTQCRWDNVIPFDPLWAEYWRCAKPTAAVVLTASQPFTSTLVMSQIHRFRHEWVWIKNRGSNFANTVREPMKEHESVLVFARRDGWTYNKQMQDRTGGGASRVQYEFNDRREGQRLPAQRVPSSWQKFNTEVGLHPTQKPVDLFRYLVRTYSNPGDLVLDNCIGSGTTAIAAIRERRRFVGIDKDRDYVMTAFDRILSEPYVS